MQVMKSHERSETIMKTKITVLLAMVMILSLFVSGFVFAGTITYTYDNAGRLTGADYGGGKTIAFTYDNNGNLLTREVETRFTITVNADPAAGGTVTGGGTYDKDSQATVGAAANAGYRFVNWTEGGTEVSASAEYIFAVTGDRTLIANFSQNPQQYAITVNADPAAGGTVTGGGTYDKDSQATVGAAANAGYRFVNWTEGGTEVSTTAAYAFTVTADRILAANFIENRTYSLIVEVGSATYGSVTGSGIDCPGDCTEDYDEGTEVQLTAAAAAGSRFIRWEGALTGTTNPGSITMNTDKQVIGYFAGKPTVTTTAASLITPTSASSGGNVAADGGDDVTVRGCCWSTSVNPTVSDSKTTDGAGIGSFTSSLAGLDPDTAYHVRAYATNSVGTEYGSDVSFKNPLRDHFVCER